MRPRLSALAIGILSLAPLRLARAGAESPPPPLEPPLPDTADAATLLDEAFLLRLGFSFLVGLAAGFALKLAFKLALILMGLILLALFALQYQGLVDVNWSGMEGQYDSWAQWLSLHGTDFLDYVGRNLSSGASFLGGLALGLKL